MPKSSRAEFSEKTKDILARRAGFRCSHPQCNRQTIGPGSAANEWANTGVASHIYSAATAGPRGRGGLSDEEAASLSNGIWLCEIHGKLVDVNAGAQFPPSLLRSFRDYHEARVLRELGGWGTVHWWIESLTLFKSPIKITPRKLDFGKVNILHGRNGAGKTAVCEWLQGLASRAHLERWKRDELDYEVVAYVPTRVQLRITGAGGSFSYFVNGRAVAFSPVAIRLEKLTPVSHLSPEDEIAYVCESIGLMKSDLPALLDHMLKDPARWTLKANIVHAESGGILLIQPTRESVARRLMSAGGANSSLFLLDLAIARAALLAEWAPTLLLVEHVIDGLDDANLNRVLARLSGLEVPFQSMLTGVRRVPTSAYGFANVHQLK